jgi:phage FluMu gp28-like protein
MQDDIEETNFLEKIKPKSWYVSNKEFDEIEMSYINFLQGMFNVPDNEGNPIPYIMTDYQKEFHSESLNIKRENAKDILFIKARGVSFTTSSCIELIVSALTFKNQVFPIIAQRQDMGKHILDICKWLIRNSNFKTEVDIQESQIKFLSTGSIIKYFPSGSASDSTRGLRLIRAFLDEFAHQNNDKELLAAVQDAMVGELGQIIIGSTPCGRNNYFFELVNKPTGFKVFRLPVFEESKFDITKPIKSQNLIPIAPWIDIDKLETKRQRDAEIFRQEHVCSFLDDSLSFIPYNLIMRCIDKKLANYRYIIEKRPDFVYETENPMYMGIDVARNNDLTAIVIFEKVYVPETEKICFLERYIEVIQNMPLPQQKEKIDKLLNIFPSIVKVRVDSTGLGTGLSDFLIQKHGRGKIEGINFSSRVPTATLHQTIPIVEKMAVNLKNLMQDDMVYFIEDDLQIHHLNDIDYDYKALRRPGLGHGDLFFACCLALLPENYRHPASGELYTNIKPQIQKQPWEESINEKIKRLENEKRKRMEGIPWKI